MTFAAWCLDKYAAVMVAGICAVRRVFPAGEGNFEPHPPLLARDYERHGKHHCDNCRRTTKHTFIEWLPERVTTAQCHLCGFKGTV